MLTKKKKLTRKEIKEDRLVSSYYKSIKFYDENKSKVLTYAGVVVLVAAAVYFYINSKQSSNEKASIQLARVMDLYDSGAYQEAIDGRKGTDIKGLKYIVDEYGSSENGETAKLFLANSYNMMGKTDEAFKYYDDYSGSNDMFKAAAKAGVAGYYESKKDYSKAAESYENASHVSKENALNPEYLLKAGKNYIAAGNKDKAKELLEKIKEEYKTSTVMRDVEKYLALVD